MSRRCLNCRGLLSAGDSTCGHCGVYLPSLLRSVIPDGTTLDNGAYRIEYPLGKGGFGITYFAHDIHLDREVAIKEFFPETLATRGIDGQLIAAAPRRKQFQAAVARFHEEGRVLARVNHQGVVRVYSLFKANNTVYLVMQFLLGMTLRDLLRSSPHDRLSAEQTRALCLPLIDALETIHRQGVYHLDLKPENILITPEQGPVLIDFGSARRGSRADGDVTYTEAYAPPELIGNKDVGAESDWYQLGVVIFEMLTGKTPPQAPQRVMGAPWGPHALDEPWRTLVERCLNLEQRDRPQSAGELLALLGPAGKPPVTVGGVAPTPPAAPAEDASPAEPPWYTQFDDDLAGLSPLKRAGVPPSEERPWYHDPPDDA